MSMQTFTHNREGVLSVRTFTHTFFKNLVPSQATCNNCQVFSLVSSKYLTFSVCSFFMMKLDCLNSLLKESCSHKNKHLDIHWDFYADESCSDENKHLDIHWDFYANICNSIDTIRSSWCVASNKIYFFRISLVSSCSRLTLNLFELSKMDIESSTNFASNIRQIWN